MPVFSGPLKSIQPIHVEIYTDARPYREYHFLRHIWHLFPWKNRRLLSCLYMGDFETSKKDNLKKLQSCLGDYYYEAGIQQVPHHFSSNNHDVALYENRLLAFGNVNDHKDVSFSHYVFEEIQEVLFLPPLVITEKMNECIYHYVFC